MHLSTILLQFNFSAESIINTGGAYILMLVIFIECGLFFGLFLPGDALLLLAGVSLEKLAVCGINEHLIIFLTAMCAFLGNLTGYYIGYSSKRFFKPKTLNSFLSQKLNQSHDILKNNSLSGLIFSRFFPYLRTIVPILSGIVKLDFKLFLVGSFIGAFIWVYFFMYLGYYSNQYLITQFNINLYDYKGWITIFITILATATILNKARKQKFVEGL
jgi:membrane-associated protein